MDAEKNEYSLHKLNYSHPISGKGSSSFDYSYSGNSDQLHSQ